MQEKSNSTSSGGMCCSSAIFTGEEVLRGTADPECISWRVRSERADTSLIQL